MRAARVLDRYCLEEGLPLTRADGSDAPDAGVPRISPPAQLQAPMSRLVAAHSARVELDLTEDEARSIWALAASWDSRRPRASQAEVLSHIFDKSQQAPHAPPALRVRCNGACCMSQWPAELHGRAEYDAVHGPLVHVTVLRMCLLCSEDTDGAYFKIPASEEVLTWFQDHAFYGASRRARLVRQLRASPRCGWALQEPHFCGLHSWSQR